MAKDSETTDFHTEIDALKKDLNTVRSDMHKMADKAVKKGQKEWDQGVDSMNHTIEDHPLGTVGAAFGIGLLAGLILSRKS